MLEESAVGEAAPTPLPLGRMAVPKRADVLVEELRSRILSGELAPGSMLPPERVLVEQTGLSRVTIREALRLLEAEGLVSIRPGRSGGSVVRRVDSSRMSRHLDLFIQSQDLNIETIFEVREALAPACAALAAERLTDEDLAELEAGNERMVALLEDEPNFLDQYLAWHLRIAQLSRNPVMAAVTESSHRSIRQVAASSEIQNVALRRLAVQAHRRVLAALAARDADAARRRMFRHVSEFREVMSRVPGLAETATELEPPQPTPVRPRRPAPASRSRQRSRKGD